MNRYHILIYSCTKAYLFEEVYYDGLCILFEEYSNGNWGLSPILR